MHVTHEYNQKKKVCDVDALSSGIQMSNLLNNKEMEEIERERAEKNLQSIYVVYAKCGQRCR